MSQPKRYSVALNDPWFGNGAYVAEDGKYVLHSDYAALEAENEQLKEAWVDKKMEQDRDVLLAENERLRKAGDDVVSNIEVCSENLWCAIHRWNAAKEGSDAK